ncbi:MAG: glycosyltransferase family 39 protein [Bacilli bacterium]|nr:glycosyltransferase family 39 protein [Bacilli bacterium]MBO6195783.1 glycosyltransferase family 39 protein [Bacilli bacterium]
MKKINLKLLIYLFLISFICIFICSKNSPIYCFNTWVDENAFMTVSKGWLHGMIPYKDLFEQKGPFLYFIFLIANIISQKSFIGVFILEVISMTISLYIMYKIIKLYLEDKHAYIILPIYSALFTSSVFFVHGGSAEEFSMPYFLCGLYILLKYFKEDKISSKEMFLSGLCAGLISMIKFNMLGFYIGFCLIIGINFLKQKRIKELIKKAIFFLIGMSIPIVIFISYLILNHAFSEFVEAYITYNTGNYTIEMTFLKRVLLSFKIFIEQLFKDKLIGLLIIVGLLYFLFDKEILKSKINKILFAILIVLSFIGLFYGGFTYDYYFLIMTPYSIFGLIYAFKKISLNKYKILLTFSILVSLIILPTSSNIEFINFNKKDLVQYKYAKIINKDKNQKILNYGWLDGGFYMMSDILPTARYFERQNGQVLDYEVEIEKQVRKKEFDYIIQTRPVPEFQTPEYIKENYNLIREDTQKFEHMNIQYYLWKRKGE